MLFKAPGTLWKTYMAIPIFIISHWFLSLFSQTFFLHRYGAHRMFTMNPFWEKTSYIMTFIFQGSSFLNPRAYAVLHRWHHAFSDTDKDPHSPVFFKNIFSMMKFTYKVYSDVLESRISVEPRFLAHLIEWKWLDWLGNQWFMRILWGTAYVMFYFFFIPAGCEWMYILLPVHFLMGPIHGAIVNWCGHKYGYTNYDNRDHSKNTFWWDFFLLGELFQNNHHKYPMRTNFATRWFELDGAYPVIRLLSLLKIIKMKPQHEG
jgi:stearoyl-CoA desaturase (Delta-9 desaturase)